LTSSAVLVPVFRDDRGELRVVLVVRGQAGLHGGQLSLPGGKQEPSDASLLETALRESEEEIALTRNQIEIVAELEPMNTRTTGFVSIPISRGCAHPGDGRPLPARSPTSSCRPFACSPTRPHETSSVSCF
jgi:8-oxo-dGTP pyrophosphatase MutT (NUDIX family)